MEYRDKLVLAPMVRVVNLSSRSGPSSFSPKPLQHPLGGCSRRTLAAAAYEGTLPFRLLAAEYGADITYGEEIIDHKFLKCERVTNERSKTDQEILLSGEIADVVSALSIPVIANGDVFEYEDFKRIKDATGAASVMVARGAMWNASIFCPKGKTPWEDVKREYVRKSILWDNDLKSTKQTIKEMIMHYSCLEFPEGKGVNKCDTIADLA
ncbi:hypothetical protein OsJ_15567 [Oryza sativa Japonica Group]|uniref:DUS-like FMN-binding domain-containing protein n=1 Tax=Oryza sativa subsp. japonica TaxID=39947 RepID=B9FGA8_ORYSJ|nr:hypothetical protein OsJ_15567 [Oryza sativa Japonica Group]